MDKLNVITCNVNGLADVKKRRQIFRYLHEQQVDIVFMQETHSTPAKEKMLKAEWGGRILFDHGNNKARGCCIMFDRNLDLRVQKVEKSKEGRFIIAQIKINNKDMVLTNIYAPNTDDPEFFIKVLAKLESYEEDFKLIGGDLNLWLDKDNDVKSLKVHVQETNSARLMNEFLEENDWVDVWRVFNSDKTEYTWRRRNPIIFSRLDYFIAPQSVLDRILDCEICPGLLSDHSFVKLQIGLFDHMKGPGYWKLNTSLLENKDYVYATNKIIDKSLEVHKFKDTCTRWELLKKKLQNSHKISGRSMQMKEN